MKKQLFSALSALTVMGALFTSCSQDELILDEPTVSQQDLQPIEFTLDVASSRGIDAQINNISSIYVYAFYEKEVTDGEGNTTTQIVDCFTEKDRPIPSVYEDVAHALGIAEVKGNIVEFKKVDNDTYAPTKNIYWKSEWGKNVTFMAIAHGPIGATMQGNGGRYHGRDYLKEHTMLTSLVADNGDIKIAGDVADHISEQLDLVTAKTTTTKQAAKGGISLNFTHAFAQVQVKFKSAEESDYDYDLFGAVLVTRGHGDKGSFSVAQDKFTEVATNADQWSYWTARITNTNTLSGAFKVGPEAKAFPAYETGNEGAYIIPGKFHSRKPTDEYTAGDLYMRLFVIAKKKADNTIAFPTDYDVAHPEFDRLLKRTEWKIFDWFTTGYPANAEWAQDRIGVSQINFDAIEFKAGCKYVYTIDLTDGIGHLRPDDPDRPGEPVLGIQLKAKITVEAFDENNNQIDLNPNEEA